MRKLITGMKISVDGKIEGSEGFADWVAGWSEDYGLTPQIDACIIGGNMYPGYEMYWTAISNEPDKPLPMTGQSPTADEVTWSRFAAKTQHYVLSSTITKVQWPNTTIIRSIDDIAKLKQQAGKDIYLMGGARMVASLLDAGLLDELRLLVYPLIAGPGKALFATIAKRHNLKLVSTKPLQDGLVSVVYRVG